MAENTDAAVAEEEDIDLDEFDTKKKGKFGLIMMVLIGLGAGAALGMTQLGGTVGPILAARAQASGGGGDHDGGGGEGAGGVPAAIHLIDNLVVNPARSQGTRFLLTSIAVELAEDDSGDVLAARDVEIRGALILVLGAKSVDELTDIAKRPGIVAEISAAIKGIVGERHVSNVFIPQFVIQ